MKVFLKGAAGTLSLHSLTMQIRIDIPNLHGKMHSMIDRPYYLKRLSTAVKRTPVTALLGPRQAGKTTLEQFYNSLQFKL